MEGGLDQLAEVELGAVEGGVGVFGVVDVAGLDERAELAEFYELGFVDDAGAEVVVEGLAEGFEEVAGGVSGGRGGGGGGGGGLTRLHHLLAHQRSRHKTAQTRPYKHSSRS